jgi:hypothetical protein
LQIEISPYSKFHTYAAELHSFDRVNQIFNFNFPQQTISIKLEQDIKVKFKYLDYYPFLYTCTLFKPSIFKEFISNNNLSNNQKEFSFKVSNKNNNDDLKDENDCRLELLKVKAKVFWEKVYRIFDDKTFVEVGNSLSYVNVGDPYFDIYQDG